MGGADLTTIVDPGDGLELGVLADQGFRALVELRALHVLVGQVARDAHELFLALQQAQAHTLLGVFQIAAQRLLLALAFFHAQVPERRHDGRHEQKNGRQGGQGGKAVLPNRRQAAPPGAPALNEGRGGIGRKGLRRGLCHVLKCRGGGVCLLGSRGMNFSEFHNTKLSGAI
jgi:hypothetical protein